MTTIGPSEGGSPRTAAAKSRSSSEQAGDHRQIKAAYNQLDFLIGTRFHSVIFSLTSGVPCIAIEYEHKSRGIMRELGLEHWVLAIGDVTEARLGRLFDKLVASGMPIGIS